MRINNNLMAMNTHRQLGTANTDSAKSIEKLSSGYRINRAGDDAAGLAISEKMRGQIRGLNQASSNAQDGISLIQTAEGALNETHAILQRMRELSVQAASDTNVTSDRGEIQKELDQLTEEIDRIANTTEFNTMKLINGDRAAGTPAMETQKNMVEGTGESVNVRKSLGVSMTGTDPDQAAMKSAIKGGITLADDVGQNDAIKWESGIDLTKAAEVKIGKDANGNLTVNLKATNGTGGDALAHNITINKDAILAGATDGVYSVDFHGVSFDIDVAEFEKIGAATEITIDPKASKGTAANTKVSGTYSLESDFVSGHGTISSFTIDGTNSALVGIEKIEIELTTGGAGVIVKGYNAAGDIALLDDTNTFETAKTAVGNTFTYSENGIKFSLTVDAAADGAAVSAFKTKKLDIKDMVASVETKQVASKEVPEGNSLKFQVGANKDQKILLGIGDMRAQALKIDKIDVSSHTNAEKAIETIQSAIETVSGERSKLGAAQNRLEHTIKNLDTSSENLQASEARIRDVDMAKEMMEQTKQNILAQASTAMLAQANQAPQAVLQLLR